MDQLDEEESPRGAVAPRQGAHLRDNRVQLKGGPLVPEVLSGGTRGGPPPIRAGLLPLDSHIEVIRDTSGAPRVQMEYEAWTQLREYMRMLDKYVESDFNTRFMKARNSNNRRNRLNSEDPEAGTSQKTKKKKTHDTTGVIPK